MRRISFILIVLLSLWLMACADASPSESDETTLVPVTATFAPLRTLVPTFTPLPSVAQLVTVTPAPAQTQTAVDPTATINFEQKVVELRYRIPSLGLDRRLEGNVSGQITVVDEARGFAVQRPNQSSVLLELQQRLPAIELEALPEGCTSCVYLQYNLPLAEASAEGWLRDPAVLASIENYTTVLVGPHFPPETVAGLRRSASPYYPGHSVAVLADGRVRTWLATEDQVSETISATLPVAEILANLPVEQLTDNYSVECLVEPAETLRIVTNGEPFDIAIRCPSYTLPTTLLPLYTALDAITAAKLAAYDGPPRPPAGFPLDAVVDYHRLDDQRLTVFADGRLTIQNSNQIIYTGTLTSTSPVSLTNNLIASGQVQLGLATFMSDPSGAAEGTPVATETAASSTSLLLVRGSQGVYDGKFTAVDVPALAELNALIDAFAETAEPVLTPTPEASAPAEPTTPQPTDTPTATPSA